jgi:hypothetical protein
MLTIPVSYRKVIGEKAGLICERMGFGKPQMSDLGDLQVRFLEELCKMWEYTRMRHHAIKEGRLKDLRDIKKLEDPIIANSQDILFVIVAMRNLYELLLQEHPEYRQKEREKCAKDVLYWMNTWVWLHEPRMPEIGLPSKLPFIPYPAQARLIREMDTCYRSRQDILICKSREAGISWSFCALDVHNFLFLKGYAAIHASEKEEKVDVLGSVKPLFGKTRYILYSIPEWMRPSTFEKQNGPNDNFRKIVNPDNGSEITGEAGRNIGRSGRASVVRIDEAQDIENPEALDFSLASVTNCRCDVGTVHGYNHFIERRDSGKVYTTTIWWYEDPRKNPEWRKGKKNEGCEWRKFVKETTSETVIAQEYDQDVNASVEGAFIQPSWIEAAIDFDLPAVGYRSAGFDVSSTRGVDESVYVCRTGPVVHHPVVCDGRDATEATWMAVDRAIEDKVQLFSYDQVGIGDGLVGQFREIERPLLFPVNGISGAAVATDRYIENEGLTAYEKFANYRAELYWNVRERFRKTFEHRNGIRLYSAEELISIPNNAKLKTQLGQPKRVFHRAKVAVEGKESMRSRGIKSPNYADAVVYAFADYDTSGHVIDDFDYTTNSSHIKDFEIDFERSGFDNYVALVQTEDLSIHALCCVWRPSYKSPLLQVYAEVAEQNPNIREFVEELRDMSWSHHKPVREWIANDEMFDNTDSGRRAPWALFRQEGITLHRNFMDDYRGSIMLVNDMFANDLIQIHPDCNGLILQLTNWIRKGGKPLANHGKAMALCQLVTRLNRKKELRAGHLKIKRDYGGGAKFSSFAKADTKVSDYLQKRSVVAA